MNRIIKAAALAALLLPGLAAAQVPQFPQTLPASTVVGRLGIGPGPSQAIPFAIFYQSILNSICLTNNAFLVYSTSSGAWVCSTAPSANTIYAGPSTGAAAQPTFRTIVTADLNTARGQFPGETSNGSATAGNVGEYIESVVAVGSATSLTTATAKTITSISLTAGDWDVSGSIGYDTATSTSVTSFHSDISLTTNTLDQTAGRENMVSMAATVPGALSPAYQFPIGPVRMSLSGTTSVFLVGQATFTASTLTAFGIIRARRVR